MSTRGLTRRRIGGLVLYQFEHFAKVPGVTHAVSTRAGGTSREPYQGLNLGLHVGDNERDVLENRRLLSGALGIEPESWVSAEQVHRVNVAVVDDTHRGIAVTGNSGVVPETDAMVAARTSGKRITLAVCSADCPLVVLIHRDGEALGVAHTSWRTTVGGIVGKTVKLMCEKFGVNASDILAGISPSIGPQCYRVGQDVYEVARVAATRCDRFMTEVNQNDGYEGRAWLLDLWRANTAQLVEAGMREENVVAAGICNHCHTEEFFSYRAEGPTTGRYGLVVSFK